MDYKYRFPKIATIESRDKVLTISGVSFNQSVRDFIQELGRKYHIESINGNYVSYNIQNYIQYDTTWRLSILSTSAMSGRICSIMIRQTKGQDVDFNELIDLLAQKYNESAKPTHIKRARSRSVYQWDENNYTIYQPGLYEMDEFTQSVLDAKRLTPILQEKIHRITGEVIKTVIEENGYVIKTPYIEIFVNPEQKRLIYTDLQIQKLNKKELVELPKYAKLLYEERLRKEEEKKQAEIAAERARLEAIERERIRKEQERKKKIMDQL